MAMIQLCTLGLKGSGKTTVVEKLKQKDELNDENTKISISSFKHGNKLVYLADTPYDRENIKSTLALLRESDGILFCISAIEPISPQLGELILLSNYVGVDKGIIIITKTDSTTPDEVESLKKRIKAILLDSKLKDLPIIPVSSITEEGFTELSEEILKIEPKKRGGEGSLKMPIELAKQIKSGLTTIFGIIERGSVKKYDKVFVMPWGKEFVVQEIEKGGEVVESANFGERVGVLFKGLYPWDVQTGDWIVAEMMEKAKKIKAKIRLNNFFKDELRVDSEVQLNIWMQTLPAVIKQILKDGSEVDVAKPGEEVEILFESKIPFAFEKDYHCIVYYPEAHWKSIKVAGEGNVIEGIE